MDTQGFLGSIFDLSFAEFITIRIIKFLFILGIIFAAIGTLLLIVTGFSNGIGAGILSLVLSPLIFLIYVLVARIWCEMIIVIFRIAENTGRLVDRGSQGTA
jgi:Domain of unknown function (DUF4282)